GSFNIAQFIDGGNIPNGGTVTCFGLGHRDDRNSASLMDYSYNFGWRSSGRDTNYWLSPISNYCDSVLPRYYLGYANQFRALFRVESRINQIYDTTGGRNGIPFKRFTWLTAYSTHRALNNSVDKSDSAVYSEAFLKCDSTSQVKLWDKGNHGEYLDSLNGSNKPVIDSARRTYVEMGLFIDS